MSETAKKAWYTNPISWVLICCLVLGNVVVFYPAKEISFARAWQLFFFYLNPYHFPNWYSTNLWLIFVGLLVALLLKNNRVQFAIRSFYSSHFWQSVKIRFKESKQNQVVVRFLLRRRVGKRLLWKWLYFWKNIRIEHYPFYTLVFTFIAVFVVLFRCSTLMEMPRIYLWAYWMFPYRFFIHQIYEPFYFAPLVEFNVTGKITWRLFIAPATGLLLIIWLLRFASQSKKKGKTP